MNVLPTEQELGFLVGSILLQVCIGENEVILRFSEEISITIEARFVVRDSSGIETAFDDARSAASSVVKLLSDTVATVNNLGGRTLRLIFSRGDILEIYGSNEGYESYQIQHGKEIFVV